MRKFRSLAVAIVAIFFAGINLEAVGDKNKKQAESTPTIAMNLPLTLANLKDIKTLTAKAEAGNAYAQAILGESYARGEFGVKKDGKQALKWIKLAEKQNHPVAFYNLGRIFQVGLLGVKKDAEKSKEYYKRALEGLNKGADQADARWLCNLGACYAYALGGIQKDLKKAVKWYTKAAEQGYARAQYNLKIIYYSGEGEIKKDLCQAMKYYELSAKNIYKSKEDKAEAFGLAYKNIHFGISKDDFLALNSEKGEWIADGEHAVWYTDDSFDQSNKNLVEYLNEKCPSGVYTIKHENKLIKLYFCEPAGLWNVKIMFTNYVPIQQLAKKISDRYSLPLELTKKEFKFPCAAPLQLQLSGVATNGIDIAIDKQIASGINSQNISVSLDSPEHQSIKLVPGKLTLTRKFKNTHSEAAVAEAQRQLNGKDTSGPDNQRDIRTKTQLMGSYQRTGNMFVKDERFIAFLNISGISADKFWQTITIRSDFLSSNMSTDIPIIIGIYAEKVKQEQSKKAEKKLNKTLDF